MGCVTDRSFSHALLERYPNRRPGSSDAQKRHKVALKHPDLPEMVAQSIRNEARRAQDVPRDPDYVCFRRKYALAQNLRKMAIAVNPEDLNV